MKLQTSHLVVFFAAVVLGFFLGLAISLQDIHQAYQACGIK
jgi:hypothetical protein